MARYDRIMAVKNVPFASIIWEYQEQFSGRDIYVSDITYFNLLRALGFTHDLESDLITNSDTETRIFRSHRVPNYIAYAIKKKRSD